MNLTVLLAFTLLICANISLALPTCEGIQILYPKAETVINSATDKSLYLILNNKNESRSLRKVSLIHFDKTQAVERKVDTVFEGNDSLYEITSIQKKLESDALSAAQDESFCFRIVVEQNGQECQQDSGKFSIVKNQ